MATATLNEHTCMMPNAESRIGTKGDLTMEQSELTIDTHVCAYVHVHICILLVVILYNYSFAVRCGP